jgi:hypothetical protein
VNTPVGSTWLNVNGGIRSGSECWDVTVRNIAFNGSSSTNWMAGPAIMWMMNLRDVSFANYKAVLGTQSQRLGIDGCVFDGFISINAPYGGSVHIGGSDNFLFLGGTNIDGAPAYNTAGGANGQYHLWFDFLEKSVIGPMYLTCEAGWNGIRVTGPDWNTGGSNLGGPVVITGAKIEGHNASRPCNGANIRVEGGMLLLSDCWVSYGMASPSTPGHSPQDAGMIHQTAGYVAVRGGVYDHTASVAETVPFLYQSGGKATVKDMVTGSKGGTWSGLPRVTGSNIRIDDSVTLV